MATTPARTHTSIGVEIRCTDENSTIRVVFTMMGREFCYVVQDWVPIATREHFAHALAVAATLVRRRTNNWTVNVWELPEIAHKIALMPDLNNLIAEHVPGIIPTVDDVDLEALARCNPREFITVLVDGVYRPTPEV